MPFWQNLELLPSSVREKARKPERSQEEYSESREKVKEGVLEAKERTKLNNTSAEVLFYIETNEEELKEKMKQESLKDTAGEIRSYDARQWGQLQQMFGDGTFDLQVEQTEEGHPTISMVMNLPEGNVQEKMQLNQSLQEALIARATGE